MCQTLSQRGATAIGLDLEPLPGGEPQDWRFLTGNLDSADWVQDIRTRAGERAADLVLAFDIIEHLRAPISFLKSCRQLLAQGGRLVITTPNVNSWERLLRPATWSGSRDPQHLILFTRYSLEFLLRKADFVDIQCDAPMRALENLPKGLRLPVGAQLLASARRP